MAKAMTQGGGAKHGGKSMDGGKGSHLLAASNPASSGWWRCSIGAKRRDDISEIQRFVSVNYLAALNKCRLTSGQLWNIFKYCTGVNSGK
jgi:hypothetical protein